MWATAILVTLAKAYLAFCAVATVGIGIRVFVELRAGRPTVWPEDDAR